MSMFGSLGGGSSYEMPDDYVAGDLAAPAELQRLRGSGATVLVEVVEGGAGAGVSCTDELVVDGIAPDSAAQFRLFARTRQADERAAIPVARTLDGLIPHDNLHVELETKRVCRLKARTMPSVRVQ